MRFIVLLSVVASCARLDTAADDDADGIPNDEELDLGTDPTRADSDGDGMTDAEELACASDPLDADEVCYACGWPHGDPGTLTHSGDEVGDTLANLRTKDQCREDVSMWDFAGSYQILFMTATWCQSCVSEARELPERTRAFTARTELPFHYTILLFEDTRSDPPNAKDAVVYADTVDAGQQIPVLADLDQSVFERTPYTGNALPGKCVVSPDMELLWCGTGHGDDAELFELIEAHAATR